jgi:hypothetical protein
MKQTILPSLRSSHALASSDLRHGMGRVVATVQFQATQRPHTTFHESNVFAD